MHKEKNTVKTLFGMKLLSITSSNIPAEFRNADDKEEVGIF
jgi:hypothetical protein